MNTAQRLLQVEGLTKIYGAGDGQTQALQGITFDALEGEFLGIMGASGSGKTTLLSCIATLLRPTAGRILLRGQDIAAFRGSQLADYRGRVIGFLFQEFELLENLTARENILLPLALHGMTGGASHAAVEEVAGTLNICDILDKFPSQLSGGQKQRVAAARALVSNPELILADEPTGALDSRSARMLMDSLEAVNQEQGKTILMVTHDASAASCCSRILFIQDGRIIHELRRSTQERRSDFYQRILLVLSQLGGGQAHVL